MTIFVKSTHDINSIEPFIINSESSSPSRCSTFRPGSSKELGGSFQNYEVTRTIREKSLPLLVVEYIYSKKVI